MILLHKILTFDFPPPPTKTSAGMLILQVSKRYIKIYYLMELENNIIIASRCPDTRLLCCLTTLSQHSGGSASMIWSFTIRQTTQHAIRMWWCSYFSALHDSVQWKYLLSSPTEAQQLPRELFLLPIVLACNPNNDIPMNSNQQFTGILAELQSFLCSEYTWEKCSWNTTDTKTLQIIQ